MLTVTYRHGSVQNRFRVPQWFEESDEHLLIAVDVESDTPRRFENKAVAQREWRGSTFQLAVPTGVEILDSDSWDLVSPESEMAYFMIGNFDGALEEPAIDFIGQLSPPNSQSTVHSHKQTKEEFVALRPADGIATVIRTCASVLPLSQEVTTVEQNLVHQLVRSGGTAFSIQLLRMLISNSTPDMRFPKRGDHQAAAFADASRDYLPHVDEAKAS